MKKAFKPEEIADLFIEYVNAANLEGIVSLYEENAVIVTGPENSFARGKKEITDFFSQMIAHKPKFENLIQRQPVVYGDIALTSSRVPNAFITVEVARKQPDGSWLWVIDQPNIAVDK